VEIPFGWVITVMKIAPRKKRVRTRQKLFMLLTPILSVVLS
jgi:hypothetical protein